MTNNRFTAKRLAALCIALVMSAGFAGSFGGDCFIRTSAEEEQTDYDQQLDDLRARQDQLDQQIAEAQAEIEKQKDDIKALEAKYTAVKAKIGNVEAQMMENEDAMVELDSRLREARFEHEEKVKEINDLRSDFMTRIKTMYVAGGVNSYENVLINSTDFYDVLMRIELVKRVAEHDDDTLDILMEKKREIEAVEKEIEEKSEELKKKSADYADMSLELMEEKNVLNDVIKKADGKLDTMALDKAAMELRSKQLDNEYDEVNSKAHTTTTTTTAAPVTEEPKVDDDKSEDGKPAQTTAKKQDKDGGKSEDKPETTKKQDKDEDKPETEKKSEPKEEKKPETTTTAPAEEDEPETTTTTPEPEPEPQPEPEPESEPEPKNEPADDASRQDKIDTVCSYARSNIGGAYVWCGENFRATDCSGLIKLAFAQIGMDLPHYAASQADYGEPVDYDDIQPGDVVFFCADIGHVGLYVGDGKFVHAANTDEGIIISNLDNYIQYAQPLYGIRRFI